MTAPANNMTVAASIAGCPLLEQVSVTGGGVYPIGTANHSIAYANASSFQYAEFFGGLQAVQPISRG